MTDAFAAAAEPTRRRILQLLARGPQYAGDIAGHFDVTRSAISQHLGVLAEGWGFDEVWYGERECGQEQYHAFERGVRALGTPAPAAGGARG